MKLSTSEKQWQAEEDARTLARYQEIMSSTARKNAAIKQAKAEASKLQQRANIMKAASSRKK